MKRKKPPEHYWNYRIMRHTTESGEKWYAMHEVYYRKGRVWLWSGEEAPLGDTPLELLGAIIMMLRAFWRSRHDILDYEEAGSE